MFPILSDSFQFCEIDWVELQKLLFKVSEQRNLPHFINADELSTLSEASIVFVSFEMFM
jgi:hypothetical protein